jgi:V8-like Glu-specific endopeptidase
MTTFKKIPKKNFLKCFSFILLFLAFSVYSGEQVIDGEDAKSDDFLPVINLDFYFNGKFLNCTGSFISAETILTAAHCISKFQGSRDPEAELILPEGFKVKAMLFSYYYKNLVELEKNGTLGLELLKTSHDVALIVLNKPMSKHFYSISSLATLGPVNFVGFGGKNLMTVHQMNTVSDTSVGQKRYGKTNIIRISKNGQMDSEKVRYKSHLFRFSNASRGDSGGPVIQDKRVIGVISGTDRLDESQDEVGSLITYFTGLHSPSFEEIRSSARKIGSTIP